MENLVINYAIPACMSIMQRCDLLEEQQKQEANQKRQAEVAEQTSSISETIKPIKEQAIAEAPVQTVSNNKSGKGLDDLIMEFISVIGLILGTLIVSFVVFKFIFGSKNKTK